MLVYCLRAQGAAKPDEARCAPSLLLESVCVPDCRQEASQRGWHHPQIFQLSLGPAAKDRLLQLAVAGHKNNAATSYTPTLSSYVKLQAQIGGPTVLRSPSSLLCMP